MDDDTADVLVVDDDGDLRDTVVEALVTVGYKVAVASNGKEALALLKRLQVRLVLLDLMMPGMDGWQVKLALQKSPEMAGLKVVLLSGAYGLPAQAAAMQPDDYLTKPVDLVKLREIVDRFCAPAVG